MPEETHAVLHRRAAAANQSLQGYLRTKLIDEASRPTLDQVLDRASGPGGRFDVTGVGGRGDPGGSCWSVTS